MTCLVLQFVSEVTRIDRVLVMAEGSSMSHNSYNINIKMTFKKSGERRTRAPFEVKGGQGEREIEGEG